MYRTMLKSKIHRATVTDANLHYQGSITIAADLMESAGLLPYERVQVVDVDNGERLETYVLAGEAGSGVICVNGAAARLVNKGDTVIIMSYGILNDEELHGFHPTIVFVDEHNHIVSISDKVSKDDEC